MITRVHLRGKTSSGRTLYYAECYNRLKKPPRKWVPLKTSSKRIAETRRHNIEHDIAHGLYDPWSDPKPYKDQVTVKESVEKFIRNSDLADGTKQTYRSRLTHVIRVVGPNRPASTVRASDIEDAMKGETDANRYNIRTATLSWAKSEGLDLGGTLAPVRLKKAEREALRPAEIEEIKNACLYVPRIPAAMPHIIDLLAATGLRRGELLGLRVNDIRTGGDIPQITVRHNAKNESSRRTIPLLPRAIGAATYIIDGRESGRLVNVSATTIYQYFADVSEGAYPGRGISPHWMRHTFITWLVNDLSLPIPVAAKIAGHSQIQTTMKYVHVTQDTVMEAISRIQGKTGPQPPSEVALWLTKGDPEVLQ